MSGVCSMVARDRPDDADDGRVRSLTHALLILERLASELEPVSLHELTAFVGLPKSTVHRLLSTLRSRGFVSQEPTTGRYGIGPIAWVVGSRVPRIARLREVARDPVARLREQTGEAVFVTALHDQLSLLVDFVGGLHAVTVAHYGPTWAPAWTTAAGRAALAHRPPAERQHVPDAGPAGVLGQDRLFRDGLAERLAVIRARGWDVERTADSTLEVAAPVRDHTAAAIGAVGIVAPLLRGDQPTDLLLAALAEAAARISSALDYLPSPLMPPLLP
jgi:DNA-binding IclR family transcriptional regulator